jgi:hypothetical protein
MMVVMPNRTILNRICAAICSAFAVMAAAFAVFLGPLNGPVSVETTEMAVVTSGEFYPIGRYGQQEDPKIRVTLDSGQSLLLDQNLPFALKNGDRLRIKVWKRRFFGHKTSYEPA